MKRAGWMILAVGVVWLTGGCKPAGPGAGGRGPGGMAMRVVAVPAKLQPVTESVALVGTVAANEEIEVKAETEGVVQEILFQEGQSVEQGQLLVKLDETKLTAELGEDEARLKLSKANFERAQQLLQDKLISQQEFDQTASSFEVSQATVSLRKRLLKDARVYAPFKGLTAARTISPGQVITRNSPLTWLVDLDPVKVEMNVPERYLSQMHVGQKVGFEVKAAYPGRGFDGEIYFIAPRLDLATRTALVKTRIPNPEKLLRSGMVASLELKLKIRDAAILVPESALISSGDRYSVFVVGKDQKAMLRSVEVGRRLPRWAEVTSGIAEGDLVIVEGHQKIGPGVPVQLAPPEKAAIYQTLDLRPADDPSTNRPASDASGGTSSKPGA